MTIAWDFCVEEEYFLLFTWREALFSFQRRLRFSSDADIVRLTNARIIIIIINDMTTVVDNAVAWSRDNGMENVFNAPAVALECLLMVRSKGASK